MNLTVCVCVCVCVCAGVKSVRKVREWGKALRKVDESKVQTLYRGFVACAEAVDLLGLDSQAARFHDRYEQTNRAADEDRR